jgi:glutamine amidotransferase
MTGPRIALVDYGMGNRRSVEKALERAGAAVAVTCEPRALVEADGLVVPGVGAFPRAMDNLKRLGLDELLVERVASGTPVLGICLGLQLFFERSTELGGAAGLGVIPGEVRQLDTAGARLPHIGWNVVRFEAPSPLTENLPAESAFYHVHSFAPVPDDPHDVLGTSEYGSRFATAVQRGSFFGVQFHPEKSSRPGLQLLANFVAVCARVESHAGA